ncbi:5 exonuclease Apollo [Olea europaea subsp. europaea]|uniref:5' exonuclease Apollo n=1 Tax=Olea europaea subsp. europaea TaxID=158383 RepID=A0A8S0RPN0_OLEEU|nr:5 exonuclease Apollo [Olea europaea subsp. europaea]
MESGMISVDKWSSGSQVYFLTHLHADHTVGLSSTWRRGLLYCSRDTAKLFPTKFPDFNLSLIRVVEIGCWHSLSLVSPNSGSATTVYVMAIDANHCPGSLMYLFRGEFGCMLYTGDFRWEKSSNTVEVGRTMLLNALKNEKLDILYLDNTYCNPRFSFPSREVAAREIVDIINAHPEHDIIIGIDSLGKEDLLLYISRTLNIKIWVWPERLQVMHLLGFPDIFTTKTALTRVRAVPRYSFSVETLECLNTLRPTIGIRPSGLPWSMKAVKANENVFGSSRSQTHEPNRDLRSAERSHEYIYTVPYSDHLCFAEIQEFIELLQPVKIKGIVSSLSSNIEPYYFFRHLCGTKQAFWRLHQKLDNEEKLEKVGTVDIKSTIPGTSSVAGRKRKKVQFVNRVSLLRKSGHGVRIADS